MPLSQRLGLGFVLLWFLGGGVAHFVPAGTTFFAGIVPPYLPCPRTLVYVSGVFELLGALGLLYRPMRRWAGLGLMLLTLAVSPANLHMWQHPEQFPVLPAWAYSLRLLLQLGLLWLIWWSAVRRRAG